MDKKIKGTVDLVPGHIGLGGDLEGLNDAVQADHGLLPRIMFFHGVSKWVPSQLEMEVEQGKWFVVRVEEAWKIIFGEQSMLLTTEQKDDESSVDEKLKAMRESVWNRFMISMATFCAQPSLSLLPLIPLESLAALHDQQRKT